MIRPCVLVLTASVLIGAGCTAEQHGGVGPAVNPSQETAAQARAVPASEDSAVAGPASGVKARCTVRPECPGEVRRGELTTSRSSHTWAIENGTSEPHTFVVVLEILDDQGRVKKKEIPAEVKAHSTMEDSSSIALMTSYSQPGSVQIEARTTVRLNDETIASVSDTCASKVP